MHNHDYHIQGNFGTIISITSAILAWTAKDVQAVVSITASIIAIVSGLFAIRYYHRAHKNLKK